MKIHKQRVLIVVMAAVAVIGSVIHSGSGASILSMTEVDGIGARTSESSPSWFAQWQNTSNYVAVKYPVDGSWEKAFSSGGR